MFFTHFVPLRYTASKVDLLRCINRGAAIQCKRGQAGIDLILPVILPHSFDEQEHMQEDSQRPFLVDFDNDTVDSWPNFEDSNATPPEVTTSTQPLNVNTPNKLVMFSPMNSKDVIGLDKRVTCILIQCRNYQGSHDSQKALARQSVSMSSSGIAESTTSPFLTLYQQFCGKPFVTSLVDNVGKPAF